jgi:hypothetical protein
MRVPNKPWFDRSADSTILLGQAHLAKWRRIPKKRMDQMTRNSWVIKGMTIQELCYQQGPFFERVTVCEFLTPAHENATAEG